MIQFNKCDCCGTTEQNTPCHVLSEPYKTNKVSVVCENCLKHIQKFVNFVRIDSKDTEIFRIRSFINNQALDIDISKNQYKQNPVKGLIMKIVFTLLLYTLFSLISLIGVTGTVVIYKGVIPSLVVLTMLSCWIGITYYVVKNTYNKLYCFVVDNEAATERAINVFSDNQFDKMDLFTIEQQDSNGVKRKFYKVPDPIKPWS